MMCEHVEGRCHACPSELIRPSSPYTSRHHPIISSAPPLHTIRFHPIISSPPLPTLLIAQQAASATHLEKKLAGVRDEDLRDLGLIAASAALKGALVQVGDRDHATQVAYVNTERLLATEPRRVSWRDSLRYRVGVGSVQWVAHRRRPSVVL